MRPSHGVGRFHEAQSAVVVPSDVPSVFLEIPRVAVVLPIWKKVVGSTNRVPYLLRKNFFFMSL